MKYPLMRNNILKEDLLQVISLLNENEPKLTSGPEVMKFEQEWSKWLGCEYSVFVNSGSSANLLCLALLKEIYPYIYLSLVFVFISFLLHLGIFILLLRNKSLF